VQAAGIASPGGRGSDQRASTCAWTPRIQSAKDSLVVGGLTGGVRCSSRFSAIRLEIAQRAILEDLDLPFGVAELLLAMPQQLAAASIRSQRFLERQSAPLHVLDDLFQFGQGASNLSPPTALSAVPEAVASAGISGWSWHGKGSVKPAKIAY
jgi:hypothetical protein